MTKITIPPAALEAGTDIIRDYRKAGVTSDQIARAAFVAMVENWPMWTTGEISAPGGDLPALILPLMEKTDDQA